MAELISPGRRAIAVPRFEMGKRPGTKPLIALPPQPKRIPLNILFGLPDDARAWVTLDENRCLKFELPGTADIAPHLSRERFAAELVYLHVGRKEPVRISPGPLLNHIGDADICSETLKLVEEIVSKTGRPCFNHPAAIAGTTRDGVSRVLTGIPGLEVPKTIRIAAPAPAELRAAVRDAGLDFPILIRVAGSHRGMNMIRVDRPDAIDEINQLNRNIHAALYVTEFRDFRSPDGRYRKFRIAMVGDDLFLRHMIVGESWLIHGMKPTDEELALFESFDEEQAGRLRPVFREISRRLDLDFFGVDCNIDASGKVLLFEANACMGILGQTQTSSNIKAATITRIHQAVEDRIASPTIWRHFQLRAQAPKALT